MKRTLIEKSRLDRKDIRYLKIFLVPLGVMRRDGYMASAECTFSDPLCFSAVRYNLLHLKHLPNS